MDGLDYSYAYRPGDKRVCDFDEDFMMKRFLILFSVFCILLGSPYGLCSFVYGANDFSGDGALIALYNLEDGALGTDSSGNGETLSGVSTLTADTTNYKQGAASAYANSSSDRGARADGDLGAGFPGKNGTTNRTFTFCAWIRPTNLGAGYYIGSKWYAAGSKRTWAVQLSGSPYNVVMGIGYNGGASSEYFYHLGLNLVNNYWYHIGCTYDGSSKDWRIRVWDVDASSVTESTGTGSQTMNIEDASFTLFAQSISYNAGMIGNIDEAVLFNDVKSAAEIDQIRAGTYGAAAGGGGQVIIIEED